MGSICLFLGSPRQGGNSETLSKALLAPALKEGWDVQEFRLFSMNIRDCVDCRRCWSTGKPCILDDDMQQIYPAIKESEYLVFASPLYWYAWSAPIQALRDRLLPYVAKNAPLRLEGKKGILVASGGDAGKDAFDGMIYSFKRSCGLHKMPTPLIFCRGGLSEAQDAQKNTALLEEARQEGEALFS